MARRTTITLIDDLDGGTADEQIEFAVDGRRYLIDLSTANSAALRGLLEPYVAAARRAPTRRTAGTGTVLGRSAADREQNQAIREWAQQQGMKIAERGRIPSNVLTSYHANH